LQSPAAPPIAPEITESALRRGYQLMVTMMTASTAPIHNMTSAAAAHMTVAMTVSPFTSTTASPPSVANALAGTRGIANATVAEAASATAISLL